MDENEVLSLLNDIYNKYYFVYSYYTLC